MASCYLRKNICYAREKDVTCAKVFATGTKMQQAKKDVTLHVGIKKGRARYLKLRTLRQKTYEKNYHSLVRNNP